MKTTIVGMGEFWQASLWRMRTGWQWMFPHTSVRKTEQCLYCRRG